MLACASVFLAQLSRLRDKNSMLKETTGRCWI
jgi:hypothetical protein